MGGAQNKSGNLQENQKLTVSIIECSNGWQVWGDTRARAHAHADQEVIHFAINTRTFDSAKCNPSTGQNWCEI